MKFLHFAEAFLFFLKLNEFFVNCSVSQELIDKFDRGRQKHASTSETKNGSVDTLSEISPKQKILNKFYFSSFALHYLFLPYA